MYASQSDAAEVLARLSSAERRAVMAHCRRLSQEACCEVALGFALRDWLRHDACAWRRRRQAHMMRLQTEEILRHKWIESEKARRDLGHDAVFDWIDRHAAHWRAWYEQEYESA